MLNNLAPYRVSRKVLVLRSVMTLALSVAGARAGVAAPLELPKTLAENSGARCPNDASLAKLANLGSIYLGEVHGTNESPGLVQCLVDLEVAKGKHPLTVSLELPNFARDTTTRSWAGSDGRTSRAMAGLLEHLKTLEQAGKLSISFQLGNFEDLDHMEANVGKGLAALAKRGQVIALGGNLHAQREQKLIPGIAYLPSGFYAGPSVKTVLIDSIGLGTAWNCGKSCGLAPEGSLSGHTVVGDLIPGGKYGYDYVYTVRSYTASPPNVVPVQK